MDKININLFQFAQFAESAGYGESAIEGYSTLEATSKSFGIIMILHYIVYVFVISYSKKINNLLKSNCFNVFYNLFFIGICLRLIFYNDFTMGRLLYYLRIFTPVIISSLLFYLWYNSSKVNKRNFYIVIGLLIMHFLWSLYKAAITYPDEYTLYKFDL